jgi:hypothetical protein
MRRILVSLGLCGLGIADVAFAPQRPIVELEAGVGYAVLCGLWGVSCFHLWPHSCSHE